MLVKYKILARDFNGEPILNIKISTYRYDELFVVLINGLHLGKVIWIH